MAEINYNNHHSKHPDLHLGLNMFLFSGGMTALWLWVCDYGNVGWLMSIFAVIPGILTLVGAILAISELRVMLRLRWLKKHGMVVWAEVVQSVHDYQGPPSGWYPDEELQYVGKERRKPAETPDRSYHVVARYVDPEGTEHLFESSRSFDEAVPFMEGDTVRVYVSKDYKKYYVDLDMRVSMFAD